MNRIFDPAGNCPTAIKSAAIFQNYGWLVIFCQLIPCVPA
jgi:hypothetical protein